MSPNKSFIIFLKKMTYLPYSVQRKKEYVLINLKIRSANKKPWAYPLSAALPFTDTYIKPSGLSILFPFSISIEGVEGGSEEGNDSGGGDCRRYDCGEGGEDEMEEMEGGEDEIF